MGAAQLLEWCTPDVRGLLRLVLFSAALSLLALYGFRRSAPAKRAFLLLGAVLLLGAPAIFLAAPLVISVGVKEPWPISLGLSLPPVLLLLWLLPAGYRISRTLIANYNARAQFMALPDLHDPLVQSLADSIAEALHCRYRPILKLGTHSCCLTLPQPLIVLPPALCQTVPEQSMDTLRAVLTHELVHARRRDDRCMLLLRLLLDWYWWMPWLKVLAARCAQAVEDSCDDRASDFFTPSHEYLAGVVAASRHASAKSARAAGGGHAVCMSAHPLVERVLRFGTKRHYDPDWPTVTASAATLLLGLMLVTGVEPVAFTPAPSYTVTAAASMAPVSTADIANTRHHQHWVRAQPAYVSRPHLFDALRAHRLCDEHLPIYPGQALLAGQEADVEVRFAIGQDGSVVNARIVDSGAGTAAFERAALRAVRNSRYPALHQIHNHAQNFRPRQWTDPHETGPPLQVRQRFRFQLDRSI